MSSHRNGGRLAAVVTVLLLAVVAAGCGRRSIVATDAGSATQVSPAAPTTHPAEATPAATAATTEATDAPVATEPPAPRAPSSAVPVATPDLSSIERLLADLDAALGADATADTDEGSPK